MITHEINVHKGYIPSQGGALVPFRSNFEMGKLEYAMYLRNLPFKKGDCVVSTWASTPYIPEEVFRINDISEIHRFVAFCAPMTGPLCLELETFSSGLMPGRKGGNLYKKVMPHEMPILWKEKIRRDNT